MAVIRLSTRKESIRNARTIVERAATALLKPSETTPLTRAHCSDWPEAPGVYGLYDPTGLIYIGESGSLSARASDLFQTRHHQFRRSLGAYLFSGHPQYAPATSRRAYCEEIEMRLSGYIENTIRYAVLPIAVGRKEIEEAVCARSPNLMNRRGRRGRARVVAEEAR